MPRKISDDLKKDIALLHYRDGLTVAEIAEGYNVSNASVYSWCNNFVKECQDKAQNDEIEKYKLQWRLEMQKKTSWTGEILGRMELANAAILFGESLLNRKDDPILSSSRIQYLIKTFDTRQKSIYDNYLLIHRWIMKYYDMAQAYQQQGYYRTQILYSIITNTLLAEQSYSYITMLPESVKRQNDPHTLEKTIDTFLLKDSNVSLQTLDITIETLLNSYYYVAGYNYTLDQIAEIFDIPEMKMFKRSMNLLEEKIDFYNNNIEKLRSIVSKAIYYSEKERDEKLEIINKYFVPANYKELSIAEKDRKKATKIISDFSAFTEGSDLLENLLFMRKKKGLNKS